MMIKLIHTGFFIILPVLSVLSFFLIFASGFGGDLNAQLFVYIFFLSIIWVGGYVWFILHLESSLTKAHPYSRIKSWTFLPIILAGTCTVFSLFLSTTFLTPPDQASPWIFIGTPVVFGN